MKIAIKTLGKKAFEVYPPSANILGILIHELAHDKYGQHDGTAHLSHDYLHEMQRIAGICFSKGLEHFIKERGHAYIESFIQNNFANEESLTT